MHAEIIFVVAVVKVLKLVNGNQRYYKRI